MARKNDSAPYRALPSVDSILRRPDVQPLLEAYGHALVADAAREVVSRIRVSLGQGASPPGALEDPLSDLGRRVEDEIARRTRSSLRNVINATGVIVHTNLGRALLSRRAREAVALAAGSYSTLEYDLDEGRRGSRGAHLDSRLAALFPGRAALAVNNNAAAFFLALNTLAGGREVLISRGELVEIGGSFRIPDVMEKSGAVLREVGTTNRTRLSDYEAAIGDRTGLILKVHPSNYRIVGFTQEVEARQLAELAHRRGLHFLVDQGSGALRDLAEAGVQEEPTVQSLLDAGADVVSFSGDKILGGPQAGIIVGLPALVERMKTSPLYRVLRLDKMAIAALEATFDAYVRCAERAEIPVQAMIHMSREQLEARARRLVDQLEPRIRGRCDISTCEGVSRVGGGAAPTQDLPTVLVRLVPAPDRPGVDAWQTALRKAVPPVIARIQDDALLLDLRTVQEPEEPDLIQALTSTL